MQQQAIPFEDKNPFEPQLIEATPEVESVFEMMNFQYSANDFDAQREELLDAKETEIFQLELESSESIEMPYFGSEPKVEDKTAIEITDVQETPVVVVDTVAESIAEMTLVEQVEAPIASF